MSATDAGVASAAPAYPMYRITDLVRRMDELPETLLEARHGVDIYVHGTRYHVEAHDEDGITVRIESPGYEQASVLPIVSNSVRILGVRP